MGSVFFVLSKQQLQSDGKRKGFLNHVCIPYGQRIARYPTNVVKYFSEVFLLCERIVQNQQMSAAHDFQTLYYTRCWHDVYFNIKNESDLLSVLGLAACLVFFCDS